MKSSPLLLLAASVSAPLSCFATEEFDDFLMDLPVVTSASRLNQSVLNSPSSVTVIDSAMIEASGFIEIAEIFRLVPGFIVAMADGSTYAVANHGEGWEYPNRMQLLIDGRSTYTSALSAIDWNTIGIEIEDIDRIEVVRGPAASAYGSNSYAGAINIITKTPELDDKLQVSYRTGNNGERRALLRHSGSFDNFNYRITASKRKNNGYEDYFETRVEDNPNSSQYQFFDDYRDNRDIGSFNITGRYQLNSKNSLWGNFSHTSGEAQMANIEPETEPGFNERDRDINAWSASLRWNHHISDSKEVKVNFFHNYLDENDLSESRPLSEVLGVPAAFLPFPDQTVSIGERTYHTHRSDIEVQYSQINDSGLQFIVGAGSRYDTMRSEGFFPLEGTKTNTSHRLFGNLQLPVSELITANVGALYEINRIDRPHLSPRASLNFHITPAQTIRVGYSKAYRIPSLLEKNIHTSLFLNDGTEIDRIFVNDEDLTAEQVRSLDISYLGKMTTLPVSWEVRAYKEEYQDTIVFIRDNIDPADKYKIVTNGANSNMYGFEGEITFRPEKYSFIRFHFNYGHMTGHIIKEFNQPAPQQPTDIRSLESHAPDKVYGVLAGKQFGNWQFNLGYYYVGKMRWDGIRGDEVDSYDRVDASISKKFALSAKQSLVFKLAGQNITNNHYNEFSVDTQLEFDPRYYASISLIHF